MGVGEIQVGKAGTWMVPSKKNQHLPDCTHDKINDVFQCFYVSCILLGQSHRLVCCYCTYASVCVDNEMLFNFSIIQFACEKLGN